MVETSLEGVITELSQDNDQYRQLFIEEAKEHIESLTKSLLALEKEPQNKEVLNTLFRSAHTLKGSSGMMGFKDFQELTHRMEDIFDSMRKGELPNSELISVLLECVDALSSRLENIQSNAQGEIEIEPLTQRLHTAAKSSSQGTTKKASLQMITHTEDRIVEFDENERTALRKAESNGEHCYFVDVTFSGDCVYKGIRANMLLNKIAELAEVVKTLPDQKELDEEELGRGFKIAVTCRDDVKALETTAQQVCEIESVSITPFDCTSLRNAESKPSVQLAEETKIVTDVRSAQTIRVRFDQLDKLMNWVGELVINKIALLQVTADSRDEGLKRITENIDRLTADLQDLVMQVRMVPVSQIFDRFPRLVRDLSLKKGKEIELIMEGRDIEVDRTMLDEIGEPLIHLLRNSIDHGIETPEERKAAEKDPKGKIKLSAQRNGDRVIIEVEDDGAGIDPEKIKKAAVHKGFATEAEVEKMSNDQLINMIFTPGFSTAKEVTETSGRGVGMDVVKTKISALGGTVHLETHVGRGTKTSIKVPLTLAIIQAILVKDSKQIFAIPTSQVSEIVQARKSNLKSLGKTNALTVRDSIVPVVHLHKLLNIPGQDEEELELLITYFGDENVRLGLAVDSVLRQQDILVKSLGEVLVGIKGISGATILGDGQVVLVLDVRQFVGKEARLQAVNAD